LPVRADGHAHMKVKLLGICGSPRKASTDYAVNEALKYAAEKYDVEADYFSAHGKKLNFCLHCDYCVREKQGCVQKDDMQQLYDKLIWADAILIGTPVYQGTLSAQTKTLLDRCRALVASNPSVFTNKIGAALAVGGDRVGGQEAAIQAIIGFYLINGIIPVGGGSFGANFGATLWSHDRGADGVAEDAEGLRSLHKTMDRFVETALFVLGGDV